MFQRHQYWMTSIFMKVARRWCMREDQGHWYPILIINRLATYRCSFFFIITYLCIYSLSFFSLQISWIVLVSAFISRPSCHHNLWRIENHICCQNQWLMAWSCCILRFCIWFSSYKILKDKEWFSIQKDSGQCYAIKDMKLGFGFILFLKSVVIMPSFSSPSDVLTCSRLLLYYSNMIFYLI